MSEVVELKHKLLAEINHSYLDEFIDQPVINENKLWFLNEVFKNSGLSQSKQQHFILTTMLVQTALDTHDRVKVKNDILEFGQADKKTQLTVLAGDYYSGLYYLLLSKTEDIDFIKTLAVAIKEINELKMDLYHDHDISVQQFIHKYIEMDLLLIKKVLLDCNLKFGLDSLQLFTQKTIQDECHKMKRGHYSFMNDLWFKYFSDVSENQLKESLEESYHQSLVDEQLKQRSLEWHDWFFER